MRRTFAARRVARVLALALTCVGTTACVGCGVEDTGSIVPEENPEDPAAKAKESMDYYRNMQKGG